MAEDDPQPGYMVYLAGVLALTDPGPAAAGVVVHDTRGRMISHRSYYLGPSSTREAGLRAAVAALRLVRQLGLAGVTFNVDDAWLAGVLRGHQPLEEEFLDYSPWFEEGERPTVAMVSVAANPARTVALAPLVQWLPERTRRAESLNVKAVGEGDYEVASQHSPDVVYRVHLPATDSVDEGEVIRCDCPDYQYRRIPCKHLLVVAQATGGRERLFYPETPGGASVPSGPEEASGDWSEDEGR